VPQNWNRRKFVTTGLSAAGVVLTAGLINTHATRSNRGCIRLLPVEGIVYSESSTRFMQRAKFDSVRDALASIRDRSLPVTVAHITANDLMRPAAVELHSMACPTRGGGLHPPSLTLPTAMPPPRPKNRKRKAPRQLLGSASSISLRSARDLIGSGNHTEALAALNTLAKTSRNTTRRAKILLLIGESETKLSRHAAAATAYSKGNAFARQATDLNLLMQTASGEIRSLLRALRTEDAKSSATAFLESGLTAEARTFLQKAIQLSPNGASRARQSLAKLALAADDPALAERYAREALLMGRFQTKVKTKTGFIPVLAGKLKVKFKAHALATLGVGLEQDVNITFARAQGDIEAGKDLPE